MSIRVLRRKWSKVWHEWLLIKDRTKGENELKWSRRVARHVKRSMGFVITDDVIPEPTQVTRR